MRAMKALGITLAVVASLAIAVVLALFIRHLSASRAPAGFPTVAATCAPAGANALDQVVPGGAGARRNGQTNRGLFGGLSGGLAGATPTAVPSGLYSCRALAPAVEAQFAAIDNDARAIGNDGYDETARGNELADGAAVFAFVRDRIRTEPYAGAMRGGLGALMSRGGSPDDKTLLLAQLLGTKGVAVRFVHAALSDAEIDQVLSAILAEQQSPSNPPSQVVQTYQEEINAAQPFINQIARALAGSNIAMASSDAALRTQWATNLRDHWWLQALENGKWVDLDPTLPNAQAGMHLGAAPTDPPQTALPSALYPTLTLRLVGDYVDAGSITTQTIAQATSTTADAFAQPITIAIDDPNAKLGTLTNSTSFTANLSVGGSAATSDPFTPDPPNGPRLLRLTLEIETDRPGYPPLKDEQIVLDRSDSSGMAVDAAWTPQRTSVSLNGVRYYGLADAGDLDPQFIAMREVEAVHELHALLNYAINPASSAFPSDAEQSYPITVMRFLERDEFLRALIDQRDGTKFYFDRPLIAFVHRVLDWNGTDVLARNDFDIAELGMDVDATNMASAVADNVARGVIEDGYEADAAMALPPAQVVTTRTLFAQASGGTQIMALAPSASPPPLPPVALTAFGSSLARGAVVSLAQPIRTVSGSEIAWWEVDPQSGSTIGRLESGAGQAEVEYMSTQKVAMQSVGVANVVANYDLCLLSASVKVLAGGSNPSMAREEFRCEVEAVCQYEVSQPAGAFAKWLFGGDVGKLAFKLSGLGGKLCKT